MGTIGEDDHDETESEESIDENEFEQSPPDGHMPMLVISKHDDYDVQPSPSQGKSLRYFSKLSHHSSTLN